MTKKKKKAPRAGGALFPPDEAQEIAALHAALKPVLARGVTVYRLASACGAHPADVQGFVEGRVSLTQAIRRRLLEQLPSL